MVLRSLCNVLYPTLGLDHKLACTFSGNHCNVQPRMRPGDEIPLFAGGEFLVVARGKGGTQFSGSRMIGGSYVHGIIYGGAWNPESAEDVWRDQG